LAVVVAFAVVVDFAVCHPKRGPKENYPRKPQQNHMSSPKATQIKQNKQHLDCKRVISNPLLLI
jgi:hypothetical protein